MFSFADPQFLFLLALVPMVFLIAKVVRRRRSGALRFSDLGRLKKIRPSASLKLRHSTLFLRLLALSFLVVAAARPQTSETLFEVDYTEGVDILIALDCSSSMQAMDLDYKKRTRLDVAKEVTADFIEGRTTDRLGLVVFAGDAYTQCPMTLDHGVLVEILKNTSITMDNTIPDGTAIGLATARCLKRLENSQAKSRVVVVLTDGENNAGSIDPLQAATIAKELGIKIYTIGTGSRSGVAPVQVNHPLFGTSWGRQEVELDEKTLREMAETTGGQYYRAGDQDELKGVFAAIDQLEKTKIEDLGQHRYRELFSLFTLLAMAGLLFEFLLSQTLYRVLP
jgi:Ca-activated chloride channel family protein